MEPQIRQIAYLNVVIEHGVKTPDGSMAIDLYPLNGKSIKKFKFSHFLRPQHRDELERHIAHVKEHIDPLHKHPRVVVLDFKDVAEDYYDLESIKKTELEFLKKVNYPEVDYYLLEGSLKGDLLLKSAAVRELYKGEDKSEKLCQLCELVMNAFKQGLNVSIQGISFSGRDYMHGRFREGVRLITLYPAHYRETYAATSLYYQCLNRHCTPKNVSHGAFNVITID